MKDQCTREAEQCRISRRALEKANDGNEQKTKKIATLDQELAAARVERDHLIAETHRWKAAEQASTERAKMVESERDEARGQVDRVASLLVRVFAWAEMGGCVYAQPCGKCLACEVKRELAALKPSAAKEQT